MASTTAVFESFDAPMVDFEYTMQSESTSVDPWYPESVMDDGDMAMDNHEGDEVDMEPRENTDIEYEMLADDIDVYSAEAIDIEVFDAPLPVSLENTLQVDIIHATVEEPASAIEPRSIPELSEPTAAHVDHATFYISELATAPTPLPLRESRLDPPVAQDTDYSASFEASGSGSADSGRVVEGYAQPQIEEPGHFTAELSPEPSLVSKVAVTAQETELSDSNEPLTPANAVNNEATNERAEGNSGVFLNNEVLASNGLEDVRVAEDQQRPAIEDNTHYENVVPEPEVNDDDDHQLEGQYHHEPAPPVILSLSTSEPEWSLFCQPVDPSSEDAPQPAEMPLLFQERQELYYEPLVSLAEALRQQAVVMQSPHFSDGELILDAYELDLVIAEDNIYSREVTLHDLTMLHQGSRLPGPLRIRAYFTSPRFILRYQELREHVARINDEENREGEKAQGPHDDDELGDVATGDDEDALEGRANDGDGKEDGAETGEGYDEHGPAQEDPAEDGEGDPDDRGLNAVSSEAEQYEDEDAYEEAVVSVIGLDTIVEGSMTEPLLNADQAHSSNNVDDDVAVDQQQPEYDEFAEDRDENYGEEVAEEVDSHEFNHGHDKVEADSVAERIVETRSGEGVVNKTTLSTLAPAGDATVSSPTLAEATGGDAQNRSTEDGRHGEAEGNAVSASLVEAGSSSNLHEDEEDEYSTETLSDHHDTTYTTAYEEQADEGSFFHGADGPVDSEDASSVERGQFPANPASEIDATAVDIIEPPEDDDDWGDEDQEGDVAVLDLQQPADPEVESNESSITLSSSAPSKRGRDEADSNGDDFEHLPDDSPGSKRVRVE